MRAHHCHTSLAIVVVVILHVVCHDAALLWSFVLIPSSSILTVSTRRPSRIQRQAGEFADGVLCPKCQNVLPTSAFSRDKARSNGLCWACKECKNRYDRALYYQRKMANQNAKSLDAGVFECRDCRNMLPASEFSIDSGKRSGLSSRCRSCMKDYLSRVRARHKEANRDQVFLGTFPQPTTKELEHAIALDGARERNEALKAWGMYFCPSCRQAKLYTDFFRRRSTKYGVSTYCKVCSAERRRQNSLCAALSDESSLLRLLGAKPRFTWRWT